MDRQPLKSPSRRRVTKTLRERGSSLLGTSVEEEDEEHLSFEIELLGDDQHQFDVGNIHSPNHVGYYRRYVIDSRKSSVSSMSSVESWTPDLPNRPREQKSMSLDELERCPEYATMSTTMSSRPKSVQHIQHGHDTLVRSHSDSPIPVIVSSDWSSMDECDSNHRRGGSVRRSRSLPLTENSLPLTPQRGRRFGTLKPANWRLLVGKEGPQGNTPQRQIEEHIASELSPASGHSGNNEQVSHCDIKLL